jgi:hypothetical protein
MDAYEMHAHEVYPYDMHACNMHAHKTHAYEMHARETHAYEMNAYCEGGSGRGGQHQQQQSALGEEGTLPYTPACTVKSRPSPTSILTTKREEKEEKDACSCPGWGCLGCVLCVSLSSLGGGIHLTTL